MKKLLFVLPIVALLAAGCYSANTTAPANPAPVTTTPNKPTPQPTPAPKPQPTSASVSISNFAFSPAALTVKKGTKVTWTNQDGVAHTVIGDNGGPANGNLANGASYSFTFNQTGTFSYHCSIHPSMTASITVTQ